MKKKIVWGIIIFVTLLIISLLLLQSFWQDKNAANNIGAISEAKADSFVPASSPTVSSGEKIIGSIQAPVKILVYEDYNNLFSAELAANLDRIKTEFGDKVAIAVRPYVLRDNVASMEAAMAIECSMDGGSWSDMRKVIFSAITNNDFSTEKIAQEVDRQGLDKEKFTKCLTSLEKQGLMLQVAENAKDFSVYGAPTTFIGNELVIGARPYDDYQDETGTKIEGLKSLVERQIK